MNRLNEFNAAYNTIKSGWFTLLLANLFGKKHEVIEHEYKTVFRRWRGTWYLTDHYLLTRSELKGM
jgi:hypothetical protein